MNHLKNIGALKADYEAGINSRVDIANKHVISAVTLSRYSSRGKWSYGKMREEVLESLSQAAIERLSKLTESVIEEHVLLLSLCIYEQANFASPSTNYLFNLKD